MSDEPSTAVDSPPAGTRAAGTGAPGNLHGRTCAGLLCALAVAGWRTAQVLTAWRDTTTDTLLAQVLTQSAVRQRAHGAAFAKRCSELGQAPGETPCAEFGQALAVARSASSDTRKFERLLEFSAAGTAPDPLAQLFDEMPIDPITGALLGRFVAETRDSERRLYHEYSRLTGAPA